MERNEQPVNVGIGITTKNRNGILNKSVAGWKNYYPEAQLVIVDDGSDEPVEDATFRFDESQGISKAKNVCIDLLLDRGCTDIFLVDDDIRPIDSEGLYRYVNSPYNHLQLTFQRGYNGVKLTDEMNISYTKDGYDFNDYSCGILLYFKSLVFDKVSGFREEFSKYSMEHIDLSLQVYQSGLTPHPFIDIHKSLQHFFSYDYFGLTESSVNESDRRKLAKSNKELLIRLWKDNTDEKISKLIRKLSN